MIGWYAFVDHEVVGPFDIFDRWYLDHAGPDWRHRERERTGIDPWLVAYDEVGEHHISTVFLGLDHNYRPEGPPLVFETMIFPECEDCWRTPTWEAALQQHQAVVALVS